MVKKNNKKYSILFGFLLFVLILIVFQSVSGYIYEPSGGTYVQVLTPLNHSYVKADGFEVVIKADYYAPEATPEAGETEGCAAYITIRIKNSSGISMGDYSFPLPVQDIGEQTYTFDEFCVSGSCYSGNYSANVILQYSCESREVAPEVNFYFFLDSDPPVILSTYPANNEVLTSTTVSIVVPSMDIDDDSGVLSKTIDDGVSVIELMDNPNYNVSLYGGNYSWKYTTTDLAGNVDEEIVNFTIVGPARPLVKNETINDTDIVSNSISFDQTSPEDNNITNESSPVIKVVATSPSLSSTITLRIFDATGKEVYINSTSEKTIESTYIFDLEGDYYYNATIASGNDTINTATRKITIDRTPPTITMVSPTQTVNEFVDSVVIEFNVQDDNGVSSKWINDGAKDINYNGKTTKLLDEGVYTWTVYARDNAGNVAKQTINFTMVKESSSSKIIIIVIAVAILLLVLLVGAYSLMRKSGSGSEVQGPESNQFPPINPGFPQNMQQPRRVPFQNRIPQLRPRRFFPQGQMPSSAPSPQQNFKNNGSIQ